MLTFVSCFHPWLENGQVFKKFKSLNIWITMIFIELLLQRKLLFIWVYTQVICWAFFDARPEISPAFKPVWSLVSCEVLCDIFVRFFCLIFLKMEFNPLPDLLNTEFTIIAIGLFCVGGQNFGSENMQNPEFFWHKMAIFGRYLIGDDDVWKHFKYWLSSSNVLLKHWTYFPKNMLINSKTRSLINLFYYLISAFVICNFLFTIIIYKSKYT